MRVDHQQVVVTVYEVICHGREGGRVVRWAAWAKVLKELSQVLLVAYSALNPIAYCGDLVYRLAWGLWIPRAPSIAKSSCLFRKTIHRLIRTCCGRNKGPSEIEVMETLGITVMGEGSLGQQLQELGCGLCHTR